MAFNGSPRKNFNTAILLKKTLEGAADHGAETELINLYDHDYYGCKSCFECKKINGNSYGQCCIKDDLKSILEKINEADAIILGSPIYFRSVTGEMRSFIERLLYPYYVYDSERTSLFKNKIHTALICTMNLKKEETDKLGYEEELKKLTFFMKKVFGHCELIMVNDTYQFDDYSKYYAPIFNQKKKSKQRQQEFPKECRKVYELGKRFASK